MKKEEEEQQDPSCLGDYQLRLSLIHGEACNQC